MNSSYNTFLDLQGVNPHEIRFFDELLCPLLYNASLKKNQHNVPYKTDLTITPPECKRYTKSDP